MRAHPTVRPAPARQTGLAGTMRSRARARGACDSSLRNGFVSRSKRRGRYENRSFLPFPTAVAAVINECPEFSGEYRIVLEGPGPYERLPLEAELASGHEATSDLEKSLAQSIKTRLSVTPKVTLMPPDSLPRTAGKTQRVIRQEKP